MTFYTNWPAKKTEFHFCCNLFKVGHIYVIDFLDYLGVFIFITITNLQLPIYEITHIYFH